MQEQILYPDRFPESVESWVYGFLSSNRWRVHSFLELEDLVQEARIKWYQCYLRYIDNGVYNEKSVDKDGGTGSIGYQHFINLFKKAFRNHLNDISNEYRLKEDPMSDEDLQYIRSQYHEYDSNIGELLVLIHNVPEDIRALIEYMIEDSKGREKRKWIGPRGRLRYRERLRDYLLRVKGIDIGTDPVRRAKDYLIKGCG